MRTPDHGILIIDKPPGITSREAIDRAARWFPRGTKLGHAGTLDPLATGVLVICIGVATRLIEYIQTMSKTYVAEFRLGATSDTDDAEGIISVAVTGTSPDPETVAKSLQEFVGIIEQRPPAFSAARVGGQRAYSLARQGKDFDLKPRKVHVYRIALIDYAYPRLNIDVHCGKGTYIRSLARDLGRRLECGAYVQSLRRTQVGPFRVADGIELDSDPSQLSVLSIEHAVSDLPQLTFEDNDTKRLKLGQGVPMVGIEEAEKTTAAVFDQARRLVAIVRSEPQHKMWLPIKVLGK